MSKGLSDKAKGKQRAVEPVEEPPSRDLMVRFTEGVPDLTIRVAKKDSVRDVKNNIRLARPQLKDRRLRLIQSGRLLTDGTFLYSWLASLEERQRRANAARMSAGDEDLEVLAGSGVGNGRRPDGGGSGAENGQGDEDGDAAKAAASSIAWLHCSVGPKMEEGETEDGLKQQEAQLKPLRGFDRLASAGFSESDIANFRRQFHSRTSTDYLSTTEEFENEEAYEEHARALEEQWIDSMDNPATASISQSSSGASASSAMLQGILVGFFFPLMPLFFFRESKTTAVFWNNGEAVEGMGSVVFSRRMQMGLVVGLIANICFGFWRYLWGSI